MPRKIARDRRGPEGTAGGWVEVFPGIRYPAAGVTLTEVEHPSGFSVAVGVVAEGGRLVVNDVTVTRREPGGPEVTLQALQKIPLQHFVRQAASDFQGDFRAHYGPAMFWGFLSEDERERMKAEGPSEWTLVKLSQLYRVALAVGEPPTASINNALRTPPSLRTIGNWIAAAREAGHLPPVEES